MPGRAGGKRAAVAKRAGEPLRRRQSVRDWHWGDSSPATRRNRLAIVKSFFRWAADERGLDANPAERIKPPKRASVERQAYAPDVIDALWAAQPPLPDQIAIQLLGSWRSAAANWGC